MKLNIFTVGKLKNKDAKAIISSYTQRLRSPYTLQFQEVKISKAKEVSRVKKEEGDAILSKTSGKYLIALDEFGTLIESVAFATELRHLLDDGKEIAFVIGGAAGLSEEVLKTAKKKISLSKMTLPHDLALVVLVEQIYRAMTIAKGIPYHKA